MFRPIILPFLLGGLALAQEPAPDPVTRQLWNETFRQKRPASVKPVTAAKPLPSAVKGTLVGITMWGFRPSLPSDAPEIREFDGESAQDLTPQRIAAEYPLANKQKIRIGIEVAQNGYLYVIDRVEYANGKKGPPCLIFPTKRILNGDNHVHSGLLVELPTADDNPPFFTMHKKPEQVQEVLTIIISPKPLQGITLPEERLELPESLFTGWQAQWKSKSHKLADAKPVGQLYTLAEKLAAKVGKPLGKTDALPQMMYHFDSKVGDTVMLDLPLRVTK